jgi:hypothetical protein
MHHVWKDINVMLHSKMKHIVVKHVKPLECENKGYSGARPRLVLSKNLAKTVRVLPFIAIFTDDGAAKLSPRGRCVAVQNDPLPKLHLAFALAYWLSTLVVLVFAS